MLSLFSSLSFFLHSSCIAIQVTVNALFAKVQGTKADTNESHEHYEAEDSFEVHFRS